MCGIVAISAKRDIGNDILDGLARLEYRGYDSFGFACMANGELSLVRDVGVLSEKRARLRDGGMPEAHAAIGHTRWATHGRVTVANTHPHTSFDQRFVLAHNGVIENHHEIRERLAARQIQCTSETDTEVVAHLLALHYRETGDLMATIAAVRAEVRGEYAFAIALRDEPGLLIGVKNQSPLAAGTLANGAGPDGGFLCSDPIALAGHEGQIAYLEDGDVAFVRPDGVEILHGDTALAPVERAMTALDIDNGADDLGDFPHYMLKEIHETPQSVQRMAELPAAGLQGAVDHLATHEVALVGSGSAFYACLLGQYFFAQLAGRYARCHPADEFLDVNAFSGPGQALVAVSQSGETFDTLRVMRAAQAAGVASVAINNVAASTSQRMAEFPILQNSGREICVLSTKSILAQVAVLYRLALGTAEAAGRIDAAEHHRLLADLAALPRVLGELIADKRAEIDDAAERYRWIDNWFFLGRSLHYPVALESALKFKEVSYLHAEGMPAGFLKHGTISLIDEKFFTVAFIPNRAHDPDSFGLVVSSVHEIAARGGNVIGFGHDAADAFEDGLFERYIQLPSLSKWLDPLIQLTAGQLFSYGCAVKLGRNIDKPRALAKAVTVR
ncbi:glutamine--fructose-6-phosphate transaminase [Rhodothalassium salexigens DSM 2132]|uniref:Glutamine--fructose-6-phosphate aminotransferase [isomerizing] n=1 Tax=Rhodothalassium salexigens DSM 2132 TaxID=1188247 RepID=A0A4R2PPT3_RHOSA|nr:glutamine--fructose-6-phosphate transaminase (isomerizing) [Rhodothalassium salexigens]MBB4210674.1 glucosamine--fructose-6-phosphate aminotransferase (isomerizing) [Rhodothalassium salexigens DSM 2132]MBK1637875.1 glutamine--fructose-6-phosphate transaminase (isomerizing) [Rhodothalassium salexigens DSM 2132]TCP37770.1 glutamine--fructose-6-phosphate transaminase [Rhodothalassium salexigens DSM 2132]